MNEGNDPLQIRPVPPERQASAIGLVFRHLAETERAAMVAGALEGNSLGEVSLAGLLEACRDGEQVGAIWAQEQPGAVAVLWPPGTDEKEPESTARELLEAAVDFLEQRKVTIAQSLLGSTEDSDARQLEAAGFQQFADLHYLVSMETDFPREAPSSDLQYETYSPSCHDRFAAVLERTYEATLDCPELNGVRKTEDILEGYRATGVFHPDRWLLATFEGRDVGCLLLADHPGAGQTELVYMGIVPEARGKNLGEKMACYSQWLTRLAGRSRIVLAVDAKNRYAIKVYESVGFYAWNRRSVFLRIFRTESPR